MRGSPVYKSTKKYGHEVGLSCAFRQWGAKSHCSKIHGYALAVKLTFEAHELDGNNWVMDFGGLKDVKQFLQDTFDHKLLVAQDDPAKDGFLILQECGIADIVFVEGTGCEAFAEMIFDFVDKWMSRVGHYPRVALASVEVSEHGANSAIYERGV